MASVAGVLPVVEPVSPELALVDPVLAARLRALLPEIQLQVGLEPDPPPRALRVLPDPGPENVLPFRPTPELVEEPVAAAPPVTSLVVPPLFPSRAERWRSLAKSFAAGAAVATFVTVGIVAKLGEGPAEQPVDPEIVPPRAAQAAGGAAVGGLFAGASGPKAPAAHSGSGVAARPAAKKPQASPKKPAAARRAEKRAAAVQAKKKAAATQTQTQKKKAAAPNPSAAPKRAATAGQKPKSAAAGAPERAGSGKYPTAKRAAVAPRRFAWAPVDGAVAYRIELFRGSKQVLEERTTQPVYELVSPWRHSGEMEKLTSGSYRWYVWPVFSSGPADQAVVQAQLRVP